MAAMQWDHAALVAVSGQSSSVVSQWLGKGSKEIKTIARVEAACRIQAASGFHAVWVAEGKGPKRAVPPQATEGAARYLTPQTVLAHLGTLLGTLAPQMRHAFADVLASWAREGGAEDRTPALLAMLQASEKRRDAA